MDSYSVAMNQRQQPQSLPQHNSQSPRGVTLEDGPQRRNNGRFDSHDDFYNFLENNRGPSTTNPTGAPGPGDKNPQLAPIAPLQHQQQQQQPQQQQPQQQQRPLPSQSRPPLTNPNLDRVRPPSFSGSRSEEQLVDKSSGARVARQAVRRGAPPTKQISGARPRVGSPTPPVSGGSSPTHPPYGTQSMALAGPTDMDSAGAMIPRLKSPSVLDCVLQPLEQKVREYEQHMRREQDEIKRLDEELHMLQVRRSEAEGRFNEVKAKHDEYRRQYNDVERAMTGELTMSPPQRPATMHGAGPVAPLQQQQPQPPPPQQRYGDDYHEEFEDDEEDFQAPPFVANRRISSQQSFGRVSQKGKERFRFSNLFGGNRN
ncbi:hypothetical protein GGS21DRAFT_518477 [Xylaria nigripes]|nr:hypothetical protein GGS21DRAFT_518477 [Xylaria nigripes]